MLGAGEVFTMEVALDMLGERCGFHRRPGTVYDSIRCVGDVLCFSTTFGFRTLQMTHVHIHIVNLLVTGH